MTVNHPLYGGPPYEAHTDPRILGFALANSQEAPAPPQVMRRTHTLDAEHTTNQACLGKFLAVRRHAGHAGKDTRVVAAPT